MFQMARKVAEAVKTRGGRALIVGGAIRDALMVIDPKDIDIEVYGIEADALQVILSQFGEVNLVGAAFGIFKVAGLDVSIPRRDSKIGDGHRGFTVQGDPSMSVVDAARRRDFTINSVARDILTGEIIDPFGGVQDIKNCILRVTDAATFGDDPLRVFRAAQFIARFYLTADAQCIDICKSMSNRLSELAAERVFDEIQKLLLKGVRPSVGIDFLFQVDALWHWMPEVLALDGVQQDPIWHSEGPVFTHVNMVCDQASILARDFDGPKDVLMWSALCHDLGKPSTTKFMDGRWKAHGHEEAGEAPTRSLLERLKAPKTLVEAVVSLVKRHLAPAHFSIDAGDRAYRRLASELAIAGTNIRMLEQVARADHFGRITPDAIARQFPAGDAFLARAKSLGAANGKISDVVMGRHLIDRGIKPGKEMGQILRKCREIQDDTGLTDPDAIIARMAP